MISESNNVQVFDRMSSLIDHLLAYDENLSYKSLLNYMSNILEDILLLCEKFRIHWNTLMSVESFFDFIEYCMIDELPMPMLLPLFKKLFDNLKISDNLSIFITSLPDYDKIRNIEIDKLFVLFNSNKESIQSSIYWNCYNYESKLYDITYSAPDIFLKNHWNEWLMVREIYQSVLNESNLQTLIINWSNLENFIKNGPSTLY
jgi:hypothetical protein